jgi:hypothetical protein
MFPSLGDSRMNLELGFAWEWEQRLAYGVLSGL